MSNVSVVIAAGAGVLAIGVWWTFTRHLALLRLKIDGVDTIATVVKSRPFLTASYEKCWLNSGPKELVA